ncbi:MAG TPA: hypothetical protein VH988_17495 [Thermoanaerobaculia bacterium]|nr:hypothetical protein [Thermoanaerobaculia bacterium]
MRHHPPESLTRAVLQALEVEEAGVVYHLLRCPACRREAEWLLCPDPESAVLRALRQEVDFQRMWERIGRAQKERLHDYEEEMATAEPVLHELLRLGHAERLERIRSDETCRSVAHLLLREAGRRSPRERRELAETAAEAVEHGLTGRCAPIAGTIGLAAWSSLGEEQLYAGERAAAEAAFERAASYLDEAADPAERARYLGRLARLRREQGRAEEALALLGRAAWLFDRAGFGEERLGILLERAWLHLERREASEARPDLEQAAAASQHLTAQSASALVQGYAWSLLLEGHPAEALAALEEGQRLYRWSPGSGEQLAVQKMAGSIRLVRQERFDRSGVPRD